MQHVPQILVAVILAKAVTIYLKAIQKLVLWLHKYSVLWLHKVFNWVSYIKTKAFILGNHKGYRQSWTNQSSRQTHVTDAKRGKTCASELRSILVLDHVHTTPRNLKKVSLWKCINCFPSTLRRRNFKNATMTGHFEFVFWGKPRSGKYHDYRDVIVSEKLRFQNTFRPRENEKPAFSNYFSFKSIFWKLCFRDRLVWTVGLTVERMLRFQIPAA